MKILKNIGIGLLIILILLVIVSFFMPSKIHVERSVSISKTAEPIFETVNNLQTWKNWAYWDQLDPAMDSKFEGPESGVGAVHKWSSKHESVGTGSITITGNEAPTSISTSLFFEDMGTTPGGWLFKEEEGGTVATIFMDLEVPFVGRIFPGMMMDNWLGKDFDKTLHGLKVYVEALPDESASVWDIVTVTTNSAQVLSTRVSIKTSELSAQIGISYGLIMDLMKKQGLQQAGPTYAVYHKYTPEMVDLEPGIVVDKAGTTEGDIIASTREAVKAAKLDYYGDYNSLANAYAYFDEWAGKNNVVTSGSPWEEYVTDPKLEPDTSKWLTRIFFPIE